MTALRFPVSTYSFVFLSHQVVEIKMLLWRNTKSMELGVLMTLLTLFYHESENKKQLPSVKGHHFTAASEFAKRIWPR